MSEQGQSQSAGPKGVQMRIKIDEQVAQGRYANNAMVFNNDTEFVFDFVYAEPARPQGQVVSRVITNPVAVKRLLTGLSTLVARYEERYGEISLPERAAAPMDPGSYH